MKLKRKQIPRREFLSLASTLAIATMHANAVELDPEQVRATDGDESAEPQWDDSITVTVGPRDADLVGDDDRVLQAAVDYVARWGGGTVQLLPGTFVLRNAIHLPSKIRILGRGADTVITKIDSRRVPLAGDSDWFDQEITLPPQHGFQIGDAVLLQSKSPHDNRDIVIKRTLIAQQGNRFKLDRGLRENLWLSENPTCAALFPLLTSERTGNVTIENVTLDGNRQNNENLNGNYGGCVFLQSCHHYTFRNVEARNYNGDGISFQTSHDVVVEDCYCHDNADLGLHPGSGSQRPVMRRNRLDQNTIGLFWCWGVKFGLAEHNELRGNRDYGMSIGHNDTHNIMRNNVISDSGKVGVLFRDDHRGVDFWANHNLIEGNTIRNSGDESGVAIDIHGKTHDVTIQQNKLIETRGSRQRTGIRLGPLTRAIAVADNDFEGLAFHVVRRTS